LTGILSDKSFSRLQWFGCAVFLGVFAYYIVDTIHWLMIWDTPIMHYVNFLITRGLHPYSDITDMNLPGAYLTEGWGMAIFGWSDVSWRVYEFFLMVVLAVSGMVLGGKRHWYAGIYAATFFIVMHGSEGPRVATERDQLMMILLVASTALFFVAYQRRLPLLMFPVGLLVALAGSIKPGAVLMEIAFLALLFVYLRKQGETIWPYLGWALVGNIIIAGVVLQFLLHHHAIGPLLFILRKIVPAYAQLHRPGTGYMLRHLLPASLMPLALLGLAAMVMRKGTLGLERWTLFCGLVVGSVSYFMQQKGLTYHRYMVVAFLALWIGWELTEAMRRTDGPSRSVAMAGMLLLLFAVVPYYLVLMHKDARSGVGGSPQALQMQQDLDRLGGQALQRQVLCLDLITGCFDALYRARLEQTTGATGDLLLFSPKTNFGQEYYRQWFMEHEQQTPANVVVEESEWYQNDRPSFDKVEAWPEYAAYLHRNYDLVVERHFGADAWSPAYRIYLRKGSAVLARELADPLR